MDGVGPPVGTVQGGNIHFLEIHFVVDLKKVSFLIPFGLVEKGLKGLTLVDTRCPVLKIVVKIFASSELKGLTQVNT